VRLSPSTPILQSGRLPPFLPRLLLTDGGHVKRSPSSLFEAFFLQPLPILPSRRFAAVADKALQPTAFPFLSSLLFGIPALNQAPGSPSRSTTPHVSFPLSPTMQASGEGFKGGSSPPKFLQRALVPYRYKQGPLWAAIPLHKFLSGSARLCSWFQCGWEVPASKYFTFDLLFFLVLRFTCDFAFHALT